MHHDRCVRCGRPTPLGVALCERDNPGGIGAPSSTQVHGTIIAGIILSFILLALLVRFTIAGIGPFEGRLVGGAGRADGGADVVIEVSNHGQRDAAATCRVSRGGLAASDDLVFLTDPIPSGASRSFPRRFAQPDPANGPLVLGRLAVRCS